MKFNERLKLLRGECPQKDFAAKMDVHVGTISRWERGDQVPNLNDLLKISNLYPGISPAWIFTGEGPMKKATESLPESIEERLAEPESPQSVCVDANGQTSIPRWQNPDHEMFDYIPMTEAKLSAGGGAFVLSEDIEGYYAFRKSWLNAVTTGAKNLVLMRVTGDSMAPTILAKDTVLIDTGRTHIKDGEIYALRVDHAVMIKRLSYRLGGKIMVISDNRREFDPFEADISEIHVLGQVIFFSRVLIPE